MLHSKLTAISEHRNEAPPLPGGVAPPVQSSKFKVDSQEQSPKARRWDSHLSVDAGSRKSLTLKSTASSTSGRSMISLGTARPAAQYYPWHNISFQPRAADDASSTSLAPLGMPRAHTKTSSGYDLSLALNYGFSAGCPELVRYVTEHVELFHEPKYQDWESCLTCGTTDALDIIFRMLCDRGDWIFAEEYCYPGTVEAAKSLGIKISGVKMDVYGLIPSDLRSKLDNWNSEDGRRPKVLYMIPSGQNPTGTTQPLERRKEIYAIAEDYNLLIVEDDPYFYLQLDHESGLDSIDLEAYFESLPRSYLSLDTCGRVLRLDSASKILAPGLRVGWLTACSQLSKLFLDFTDASSLHPSGVTQLILKDLLEDTWQHEGLVQWLNHLSIEYTVRRNCLLQSCERHLPKKLCHWNIPQMGMFVWIIVDFAQLPSFYHDAEKTERVAAILNIETAIFQEAKSNGILVSCGSWFASQKENLSKLSFRLTFAATETSLFDEAIQIFGRAITTALSTVPCKIV